MNPGGRTELITFQRKSVVDDEYNEEVITWGELTKEWAQVFWGRGDERRQAAVEQGAQPATFSVPSNEITRTVGIVDRIDFQGVWDIVSIAPTADGSQIEFTATRTT